MKKMRSRRSIKSLKEMLRYIRGTNKKMAEIGCYGGEATRIFSKWCKEVHAIDPWEDIFVEGVMRYKDHMCDIEAEFDKLMNSSKNIKKYKMTSEAAASLIPDGYLYFVYIDGWHSYEAVCMDSKLWTPKVIKNGWICGHDFTEKHAPCRQAVFDMFGLPEKVFGDGSWVVKNRGKFNW